MGATGLGGVPWLTIGGLSLTGGGALDFDLSSTTGISDALAFTGGGTFTNVGTTALNFANVGTLVAGNTYTLISGATGISASDFTYNANQFTGLSLDVTASGGDLFVTVQGPPPPPTVAYWNGTVDTVWSDTGGSTTNWVDANGVGVALPTRITQIFFSATGATKQASTTIGAISAVDSITLNDPTNLTIGGASTLTLEGVVTGSGITVASTAGTDVISVKGIALGGSQTWANNSSNLLTVSSVSSGASTSTLTINGTGSIGGTGSLTKTGTGTLTLSTANTYSGGTNVSAGLVVITPTSPTTSALPTGAVTLSGSGELQLATNVTLGSQPTSTPASNVNITALSIAGSGTLDITNNHIIIDYTPGNDPITSIAAWIVQGFAGGTWTGTGITSTAAQANSGSYGIAYADAADPGNPAGLAVGQIEIAYTLLGDANLDGKVNGTDFNILAANFNTGGDSWDQGDFNYDTKVNGSDFNVLAANFNQGATQSALVGNADLAALNAFTAANGITLTSVPEPASTGLMTLGAVGVLAR